MKKWNRVAVAIFFLGLRIIVTAAEQTNDKMNESAAKVVPSPDLKNVRVDVTQSTGNGTTGLTNSTVKTAEEMAAEALDRELKNNEGNPAKQKEIVRQALLKHKDEFLAKLNSQDPHTREEGIDSVIDLNLREAIPKLREMAIKDPDEEVRIAAAEVLASMALSMNKDIVLPVMLKALGSKDRWRRRDAAVKLVELRRKEGIAALIQLLDEGDEADQNEVEGELKGAAHRNFGEFARIRAANEPGPGSFAVIEDYKKRKIVFEKWKNWWKEEGDKFVFPEK